MQPDRGDRPGHEAVHRRDRVDTGERDIAITTDDVSGSDAVDKDREPAVGRRAAHRAGGKAALEVVREERRHPAYQDTAVAARGGDLSDQPQEFLDAGVTVAADEQQVTGADRQAWSGQWSYHSCGVMRVVLPGSASG